MASYDATNSECLVFTFKEGLLSPVAHDLKIAVERFAIDIADAKKMLTARFDPTSLRVVSTMKNGSETPALSPTDKAKIAQNIRDDVLQARKYPEIRFVSNRVTPREDGGYDIAGELTLHGVTQRLVLASHVAEGSQVVEYTLHQPDFGIAPYKAMMGALKVQADVKVRITLPAP